MMAANASAIFGLSITEKWIRERLNLHKEALGELETYVLRVSATFFPICLRY